MTLLYDKVKKCKAIRMTYCMIKLKSVNPLE